MRRDILNTGVWISMCVSLYLYLYKDVFFSKIQIVFCLPHFPLTLSQLCTVKLAPSAFGYLLALPEL